MRDFDRPFGFARGSIFLTVTLSEVEWVRAVRLVEPVATLGFDE